MRTEDDQGERRRGINMSIDKNNNIFVTISEDGADIREKNDRKGDQEDKSPKLNAVINSFRDRQFKGFDEQSIMRHLEFFESQGRIVRLTGDQMADFFMNTLAEPALSFFQDNVRKGMSYFDIRELMLRQFNNPSRQSQMKRELDMLRMSKIMREGNIQDPLKGLDKVIRRIGELTVQVHEDFRTDRHKIGYLTNSVAEFPWAMTPIQNIEDMEYSF